MRVSAESRTRQDAVADHHTCTENDERGVPLHPALWFTALYAAHTSNTSLHPPTSASPPTHPLAQLSHFFAGLLAEPLPPPLALINHLYQRSTPPLLLTLLRSSVTSLLVLLELFSAVVWSLSVRSISSSIWRISVVTCSGVVITDGKQRSKGQGQGEQYQPIARDNIRGRASVNSVRSIATSIWRIAVVTSNNVIRAKAAAQRWSECKGEQQSERLSLFLNLEALCCPLQQCHQSQG